MFFLEKATTPIDVMRPFGWAGDHLIWAGARSVIERHGIEFRQLAGDREIRAAQDRASRLYVYGSGGFCREYHSMPEQLRPILDVYPSIVILPSSFETSYEPVARFIADLPRHVIVFCRERYSLEMVRACSRFPENVFLEEDTAFQFDYSPWLRSRGGKGCLREFHATKGIDKRFPSLMKMLDIIRRHEEVITDRTHLAIAAAMLKKRVVLYPGSYHKGRGIYEFSLSRFSHVRFVEL
ncbi:MAG: polysaccharide pyruvyl transferase family protein [Pirellulales bacterium]|nr:polysaccharide pyruvyl transferase family protein [Pirellulales bacterium]